MHYGIEAGAPVNYSDDSTDSAIDDSVDGRFREQLTGFGDAEDEVCADDGVVERLEAGAR